MLEGLPDVVRRHFELDPHDVEAFVSLFSDNASTGDLINRLVITP